MIPVPDVTNSFPEYLTFYVCQRFNDMQRKRSCFSLKWALEPTVRWRMVPLNIAGFMYAVSPYSPHLHIYIYIYKHKHIIYIYIHTYMHIIYYIILYISTGSWGAFAMGETEILPVKLRSPTYTGAIGDQDSLVLLAQNPGWDMFGQLPIVFVRKIAIVQVCPTGFWG